MKRRNFSDTVKTRVYFCQMLVLLLAVTAAFTIGYSSAMLKTKQVLYDSVAKQISDQDEAHSSHQAFLFNEINAANIEKHLKYSGSCAEVS